MLSWSVSLSPSKFRVYSTGAVFKAAGAATAADAPLTPLAPDSSTSQIFLTLAIPATTAAAAAAIPNAGPTIGMPAIAEYAELAAE